MVGFGLGRGPTSASDPTAVKGAFGPYFQMQRLVHYKKYADELVAAGKRFTVSPRPKKFRNQKSARRF
jgi:glutamyl/glutaminyl-tRNA synthetase